MLARRMSLVLIANRLGAHAWDHGPIVAAVAAALRARDLAITLIADSIEDTAAFEGVTLRTYRPYEQTATAFPIRFPRWAARAAVAVSADRVISLTHRVAAPVWMPIDRPARGWLAHHAATRGPIGLAATIARTPGAFVPGIGRVGAPGPPVAPPPFSLLSPPHPDERLHARVLVRALLSIPPDHRLLIAAAPEAVGRRLDPLLAALTSRSADTLAILARDTFTIERRAASVGGEPLLARLRILTLTRDIRPLLLAADAAITFPSRLNRFASDAAVLGTPHEPASPSPASPAPARPLTPAGLADFLLSPTSAARPTIGGP
jgi:hypothetical protein